MKSIDEKISYLNRLLNVYIKFFKHYKKVKLNLKGDVFIVKYYDRKVISSYVFKEEEIPIDDIDKYILSIKNKINREFSKRGNNKYLSV